MAISHALMRGMGQEWSGVGPADNNAYRPVNVVGYWFTPLVPAAAKGLLTFVPANAMPPAYFLNAWAPWYQYQNVDMLPRFLSASAIMGICINGAGRVIATCLPKDPWNGGPGPNMQVGRQPVPRAAPGGQDAAIAAAVANASLFTPAQTLPVLQVGQNNWANGVCCCHRDITHFLGAAAKPPLGRPPPPPNHKALPWHAIPFADRHTMWPGHPGAGVQICVHFRGAPRGRD